MNHIYNNYLINVHSTSRGAEMLSLVSMKVRLLCRLRPQFRIVSQYTVKRKGGITYADMYTKDDVMENLQRVQSSKY